MVTGREVTLADRLHLNTVMFMQLLKRWPPSSRHRFLFFCTFSQKKNEFLLLTNLAAESGISEQGYGSVWKVKNVEKQVAVLEIKDKPKAQHSHCKVSDYNPL